MLDLLAELAAKSTAEEGNLLYQIFRASGDPNTLILFEGYIDDSALAQHRNSEHYRKLTVGQIIPLLENRGIVVAALENSEAQKL